MFVQQGKSAAEDLDNDANKSKQGQHAKKEKLEKKEKHWETGLQLSLCFLANWKSPENEKITQGRIVHTLRRQKTNNVSPKELV